MPTANVYIADRWGNGIGFADITSGEATAGDIDTSTWVITNNSNAVVSQLKVWIRNGITGITISDDNIAYVSPVQESDALSLGDVVTTVNLYVKRTIVAGATFDPNIYNILDFSFTSI